MPVIAEMKVPKSFPKALFSSQGALAACYIAFGTVVYMYVNSRLTTCPTSSLTDDGNSYCGEYVASPSLASAGGTIEKIAYGISVPGFIMTSTLWVHLAAKFVSIDLMDEEQIGLTIGSF